MKKLILLSLLTTLLLSSCSKENENNTNIPSVPEVENPENEVLGDPLPDDAGKSYFETFYPESENLLTFDKISYETLRGTEVIITGNTNGYVTKIEVTYKNEDSISETQTLPLPRFSAGDVTFRFVASAFSRTLDFGKNEFEFKAYKEDGETSNSTIVIYKSKEDAVNGVVGDVSVEEIKNAGIVDEETEVREDDLATIPGIDNEKLKVFPENEKFGERKNENGNITYSEVPNTTFIFDEISEVNCEDSTEVTNMLLGGANSWIYWNTCRYNKNTNSLTVNALFLRGDKYFYEKHYVDFDNNVYGINSLESGEGLTGEDLEAKNMELRGKEFDTSSADAVFSEITK